MSIVIAITWFALAFILGLVAAMTAGLITSLVADELSESIGEWYIDMGMTSIKNAALAIGETGGASIVPVSWAPKLSGDVATIGGEKGHWQDPLQVKSSLSGKSFGIAPEGYAAYISPVVAELGKEGKRAIDNGALGPQDTDDDSETVALAYWIDKRPQVLDLRNAAKALRGSCKRRWSVVAEEWGRISQEGFHERISGKQTLMIIAAFAVGVGMAFILVKYGGSAGGGVTRVNIP